MIRDQRGKADKKIQIKGLFPKVRSGMMTTKRISVTQPLYIIETKKEFMNNYKLVNNNDWIAIATVFVAISAIFIGAWQANETLHATIKPLLDIETMDYPYEKNMML